MRKSARASCFTASLLTACLAGFSAAEPRAPAPPRASELSIEELAGQLFMIALDTEIAAAREADIRAGRLGGALLRWDRFSGEEAAAFSARMREWAASSPRALPFWLAADHEGGAEFTQRRYGLAGFPGNMALGAAGSEALARESARAMGRGLSSLGISVTFAPVLDAVSNPETAVIGARSFGEDPALVARLGAAALRGYRESGVLAVPKHFPGHGSTAVDSHLGLPVSTRTLAELERSDLIPFRAAVAAGAEALMPAHMVFPALGTGPREPVTLSSAALEGFLRGRLGFRGLVFSDSLDMGAVAGVRGSSEAALGALEAGADVLLLGKGDFPAAFAAVVEAVRTGRIARARLERSAERVLRAKRRLGLFAGKPPRPLGPAERRGHEELAREAARRGLTLVRDSGLLPLRLAPEETLGVALLRPPRFSGEAERFVAALARRHPKLAVADLAALSPSTAAVEAALGSLNGASAVVLGTYFAGQPASPRARRLIEGVLAGAAPVAAVSLMYPYDLALTTRAAAALCVYGMTDASLEAAAAALFGELAPGGRLPVSVPGAAARGARARPAGLRPPGRRGPAKARPKAPSSPPSRG